MIKNQITWSNSSLVSIFIGVFFVFGLCCSLLAIGPSGKPEGFTTIQIGDKAPAFSLPGVDGKTYSLKDFRGTDVLMILFTGTHCPTSHGIEERLKGFISEMEGQSFSIVAINPNHSSGLRPDEFSYTDYEETFADSKRYAADQGWKFPFLYDGDKQLTARAYGCLATPHVFIFDKSRKLRYKGRYDDSRYAGIETVKSHDAVNAVKALLAGKPVPVAETKPFGCSTKWRERSAHVADDEKQWQSAKATVELADAAAIGQLRKNGSGKYRLFNVWATWCAPCVKELPDLASIGRLYSRRDFDLITISLDSPEHKEKVQAVLGKHRFVLSSKQTKSLKAEKRATNNYIYTGSSTDQLVKALDPEWPGPIPYTLLVDPAGQVIYRRADLIDPVELRSQLLKAMGNHYVAPTK